MNSWFLRLNRLCLPEKYLQTTNRTRFEPPRRDKENISRGRVSILSTIWIHVQVSCPLEVFTHLHSTIKFRKNSISPPQLLGVDYITPNLWNGLYYPLNFLKSVKLPPKAFSKNHSKSQKNHKIENPIVLDSKWVDLHSEYIIWYALVYFFSVALDICFSS